MFFLESKTIPGSCSFCCVITLEYCHFQTYQGSQALHPVSIQVKEMKFPLMMFEYQLPV